MDALRRYGAPTVGSVGALGVALVGLSPTGVGPVDVGLVVLAAGACIWFGSRAPWWAIVAAAALVGAAADTLLALVVALVGLVLAGAVGAAGDREIPVRPLLAIAVAAVVYAASDLHVPGPFGMESVVGLVACTALLVLGIVAETPRTRRWAFAVLGIVAGLAVLASAAFALAALGAADDLRDGNADARRGLRAVSRGDADEAASWFASAAESFRRADDRLDAFWTQPARLVPVIAQHRTAGADLAGTAGRASAQLAATLSEADVDSVRLVDGRIDLEVIGVLERQLTELQAAVDELADTVEDADDPWLVAPVRERLTDLSGDLVARQQQGEDALLALRTAPSLLGADEPKVYLVAFVTPVEARGSIGFLGNVAELTIDNGAVELTSFRRHEELRAMGDPLSWRIEGMPEFLSRYGRFGFATGPGGTADGALWKIITMSPHFPSTAEVISQIYPLSGGRPIDGVLALDPTVVATLLEFTGPIEIDGAPALSADDAAEYLHVQQYVDFERDDRIDMLELLGLATIDQLLDGALPGPVELGQALGPLAEDRHLAAWFADPDAQHLAETVGIDHSLPEPDGGDALVVSINNGSAGKLEAFLDTDVRYVRRIDPATGHLEGRVIVTLTNNAPSSGLPRYVIGNTIGLPIGTSKPLLGLYAPFRYTAASIDGEPIEMTVDVEQGWTVMGTSVELAAGQTRVVEMTFEGVIDVTDGVPEPVTVLPNLARGATLDVETSLAG